MRNFISPRRPPAGKDPNDWEISAVLHGNRMKIVARPSEKNDQEKDAVPPTTRGDYIYLLILILIYGAIALINTGAENIGGNIVLSDRPPLTEIMRAWPTKILGAAPLSGRLSDTVMGILLIPMLYAFARRLFVSNRWAIFTALAFAFNLINLFQLRAAMPDACVAFFVLAMYFFMFLYTQSIHQPLRYSVAFLTGCAVCLGLAAAGGWPGICCSAGLPLLFLPTWCKMHRTSRKNAYVLLTACFVYFVFALAWLLIAYTLHGVPPTPPLHEA